MAAPHVRKVLCIWWTVCWLHELPLQDSNHIMLLPHLAVQAFWGFNTPLCVPVFSCVLRVVLSQLQLYGAECLMVTDFPKYNKHTCTRTCMYTYVTDIMFPAIQGVSIIGKCTASQY